MDILTKLDLPNLVMSSKVVRVHHLYIQFHCPHSQLLQIQFSGFPVNWVHAAPLCACLPFRNTLAFVKKVDLDVWI